jgi:pimeloyl-ACP methyl ester carboxylesterase
MALRAEVADTKPKVVLLFTGAGTTRQKNRPLLYKAFMALPATGERLHAGKTARLYKDLGETVGASGIIVPDSLGVGTPELTYANTQPAIDHFLDKHPDEDVEFIAHSLGGVIAAMYSHRHPERNIGVKAAASPWGKVKGIPLTGYLLGKIRQEVDGTRREMGDGAPQLTLIGSDGDRFIDNSSTLPDIAGAQRIVFTRDAQQAIAQGLTPIEVSDPPGHLRILDHPAALGLYENSVPMPSLSVVQG